MTMDKRSYVRSQGQTREHRCHWPGCERQVPPAVWGCKPHWFALPKHLRDLIWKTYEPGQEVDLSPSAAYLDAADKVQEWIRSQRSTPAAAPAPTASSVLDALGPIPRPLITLDFESYFSSTYHLMKQGGAGLTTEEYVRDPRFEVLGVGVKVGTKPAVWMEDADFRSWAATVPWGKVRVLAQHAHFEGLVLSHHYGVRPGFWLDTLSISRALHGPGGPNGKGNSLGVLATYYNVGTKGDELTAAKGKRRRDFTPAEWLTLGGYCCNDDELTYGAAAQMVPQMPPLELWLIDATIRMFSEPRFHGNIALLEQAAQAERDKKTALLHKVAGPVAPGADPIEAARARLSSNPQFAALLRERGIEPGLKPNKKGEQTFAFAAPDPFMKSLLEHEDPEIQALAEARLAVKSTLKETRAGRFAGMARRGPLPVYLNYAKAHTNRWGGGDKANWQNLDRVDPKDPAKGMLKRSVEAPPGHMVIAADSGQIEARKLAWLALEERALETFRKNDAKTERYEWKRRLLIEVNGLSEPNAARQLKEEGVEEGDFYADKGSMYFGKRLSKKDTPAERQVSKAMELGLGFQMGTYRFALELLKGLLGLPPMQFMDADAEKFNVRVGEFEYRSYGRGATHGDKVRELIANGARLPYRELLVHCAVADHFVQLYRRSNSRVVAYWETMSKALAIMAQPGDDGGRVRERIGCLEILHCAIRKPSGLVLHYPRLTRSGSEYRYWGYKEGRMQWCKIYGGLLTENVVQSLARDVVAEQAMWIRASGFPPATLTHDEVVCLPREEEAQHCLSVMLAAMKRAPAWCADLPLNASGGMARTYGGVK
jgi:hypothetical protein